MTVKKSEILRQSWLDGVSSRANSVTNITKENFLLVCHSYAEKYSQGL